MQDRDIATSLRLLLLFGSRASRLGWLQLAVGFAGVLVYNVVQGVDTNFYRYWGTLEKAEATVIGSVETEHTYRPTNRAKHTWEDFDEVRFRFVTPDGAEHEGTSLTSKPPADGARVEVEYPQGSPSLARIVGTSRDPTSGVAPIVNGIVLVVALNGLLLVLAGLRSGLRHVRLLTRGEVAKDADGATVLRDPQDPERNVVLGALPGRPRRAEEGGIAPQEPVSLASTLVPPVLGTTGLLAYVLYWIV